MTTLLDDLLQTYIGISYDEWVSFGDKPVTLTDIKQLLTDIQWIEHNN